MTAATFGSLIPDVDEVDAGPSVAVRLAEPLRLLDVRITVFLADEPGLTSPRADITEVFDRTIADCVSSKSFERSRIS